MDTCRDLYTFARWLPAWVWAVVTYSLHAAAGIYIGVNLIPWVYAAHKAGWF
jgi:hypothetical protein